MHIAQAQADVRRIYRGGSSGALVSALLWFAAAAVYQLVSPGLAMLVLFVGGTLIFPLSTLVLKAMGGPSALPRGHPAIGLAMQSAFAVPLGILVAVALGSYEPTLFFPASLIIVGAHFLVFISLYGMRIYAVLAGALIAVGTVALFWLPQFGAISGWVGASLLLLFALPLYRQGRRTAALAAHY
ncbi:hypothetical protein [Cryobacterium sp. PH29-G1]|uniref:DUF7010 family protein n=1 Tax=Cryobacterium sp. PH29-G1 TaxID=3046211 RepID=UPI0024BA4796|nr:hypothetical protein [Cryobacterium sp. PH29-G1]MDJ0348303.1 hypothetical protein [Cryobacterium sp. PH29-G1]